MSSECSQAVSAYPSLSSYPAEFRGATDYPQTPSAQYLLHHWNHTRAHYYCDECGALVCTTGGITYHGTTTTNQDGDASENSSSDRSGGGVGLRRSPAIGRQRPALVCMSPVHRIRSRGGPIARYAESIGHAL
ncbi:hypothetical protein FIBSPDRAFT_902167 [Athelia psychrophila]|uniref:Uncharacterized protein n=1 Tax=Athelia psychrophila TaxID=1759441 RepID=A0A167XJ28_9AGAM|nr:hypothetical protein FIBSPDRAFT_902167 [Fibularhizoctonia sp. CBS 109695]